MRSIFKKLAQYAWLRTIIYIVLGILMIAIPQTIMNIIVYILAGYAILMGILGIVNYLRHRADSAFGFDFVAGVLWIVLGVVLLIFTRGILSILPIFLGILLILGGAGNLVQAISGGQELGVLRIIIIVLSVLIIIGGIVIIANPFDSAVILFQVFGFILIVHGVGELITYISFRRMNKE